MLPLALIALVALVLALDEPAPRRSPLALVPIGIAVIAISLAVDAPKGLDEGEAALAYEGATREPARGLLDADRHRLGADRLRPDAAALPAAGPRQPRVTGPGPSRGDRGQGRGAAGAGRGQARMPSLPRRAPLAGAAKRKVQGAGT